ncbi:autotransporter outer membrane beta-barrel domain-containing protein [Pelagibacterium montanilacus]|uniref:autotransporter outer membrane beta-barrel domain-containing protein n=1 Tax=Pelagibacterium montanilacus TaxID=2185280 RepID=UPI0013E00AEF|nr:autotransporter outer membrane beta-barrel domain-containing protein [Pelagibacterium montanilacus]
MPTIDDIVSITYGGAAIADKATAYSLTTSGGINVNAGGTLTVEAGIVNTAPENVYFINDGEVFADIDSSGYLRTSNSIEGKLVVREDGDIYNQTSSDDGAPIATWLGDVENAGYIVNSGAEMDGAVLSNTGAEWDGAVLSNTGTIVNSKGSTWDGEVLVNTGEIRVEDTSSWTGTVHSSSGNLVLLSADSSWHGDVLDSSGSISSSGNWYGSIDSTGWLHLSGYVGGDISSVDEHSSQLKVDGNLEVDGDIFVDGSFWFINDEFHTLQAENLELSQNTWLEIDIDAGNNDRIELSGTATLAGNLWVQATTGENYVEDMRYSILSAESISGTFGYVGSSNLDFLTPMLSIDGSELSVVLKRNGFSFADGAAGANDKAAAGAIDSLGAGNSLYEAALNLSNGQAPAAFSGLAGDIHATAPNAMMATTVATTGQVINHLHQSFDALGATPGPAAYAASGAPAASAEPVTGPWGTVYGVRSDTEATDTLPGSTSVYGGVVGGIDTLVDTWRVGIMLEAGSGRSDMNGHDASTDTTSYGAGVYAGNEWGDTRLLLGGSITGHAIESRRTVTLPELESLEADYGAATAMAFAELAHRVDLGAVELTPRIGLSHVRYSSDGYTETGGDAALTGAPSAFDNTFATLGFDIGRQFILGESALLTASGSVGWRHAFGDAELAEHAFGSGPSFSVDTAGQAADTLMLGADLAFDLNESTVLGLAYGSEHAEGSTAHSLKASWNGRF